ncbi:MAG TPA: GNAT family N-acetyltransferase [Gallicola sp.]|nr:GNAT family N-acetyltransferase [Gallicola sp.]
MNNIGTVMLETKRLILRKISLKDIPFAYKNWVADEEVTKFITWKKHKDVGETKDLLEFWINKYKFKNTYRWIIELKEMGEPIGIIDVVSLDEKLNMAVIGYAIGKTWWNKGIVTEAFSRIIKFLFESVKLNRVEAIHMTSNIASGKVMEKCGLKYEGTNRQRLKNKEELVDVSIYGILAEDYFKGRKFKAIVDRPVGYVDDYKNVYPINYGFIPGIISGDGEEQDAYILTEDNKPLEEFTGELIAKIIRKDDVEEKWVLGEDNRIYSRDEIFEKTLFMEQHFDSIIKIIKTP